MSRYTPTFLDKCWKFFGNADKKPSELEKELHYAALTNLLWRAEFLMTEKKISPTSRDNFAIRWAAHGGHNQMIMMLLDHGADLNARDGEALVRALENGHPDTALLLVEKGARVGEQGGRALFLADDIGNLPLVCRMLSSPEDLTATARALKERAAEKGDEKLKAIYDDYLSGRPVKPPRGRYGPPRQHRF
jgi:Ankyrin repeats (3 copies)